MGQCVGWTRTGCNWWDTWLKKRLWSRERVGVLPLPLSKLESTSVPMCCVTHLLPINHCSVWCLYRIYPSHQCQINSVPLCVPSCWPPKANKLLPKWISSQMPKVQLMGWVESFGEVGSESQEMEKSSRMCYTVCLSGQVWGVQISVETQCHEENCSWD